MTQAPPEGQQPDGSGYPGGESGPDAADDGELRQALTGLSRLVMAHGQQGLEGMLRHIADFAVRAIPGADGAGLTLLEDRQADTVVSSDAFVREVDAIQYGIGEGPCITAAAERRTVTSGELSGDHQWPRFGPRVGRLGVHSALSLPLLAGDEVLGAMNIYAHAKDAFDARSIEMGELFAVPAAISVQNARVFAQTGRLTSQLQNALTNRAVIDQALGILMSRSGCSPEEAIDKLKAMSQAENRKLSVVAHQVLAEAVRRARARRLAGEG